MALSSGDSTLQGLQSAVIDDFLTSRHVSFFNTLSPLFATLLQKGRIRPFGHGNRKRVPAMFPTSSGPQTEGITNPYAERSPMATTGFDSYEYTLAHYGKIMPIDEYELRQAGSNEVEKVRWKQAIIEKNLMEMKHKIAADLMANPETANSNGLSRARIGSLQTYLNGGNDTTTADSLEPATYSEQLNNGVVGTSGGTPLYDPGGIPRNATLAARVCTPVMLVPGTASQEYVSVKLLAALCMAAKSEGNMPDLILVTPQIWIDLQQVATFGWQGTNAKTASGGQVFGQSRLANLGFDAFEFMGADVVVDRRIPTSGFKTETSTATLGGHRMYAINTEYLWLEAASRRPMTTPFSDDKSLEQYRLDWMLQLVMSNGGNVHAVHPDVTALS